MQSRVLHPEEEEKKENIIFALQQMPALPPAGGCNTPRGVSISKAAVRA